MNRHQRRASAKQSAKSPSLPRHETPAAFVEAGLRLLKAGQLAEAEKCGQQALAIDPDTTLLYKANRLGRARDEPSGLQ